ncbi:MAG: hypothetical protein EXR75_10770 [Myxococcales bacterium]|nr:hypothetical protein [Myxococcales bacterium]
MKRFSLAAVIACFVCFVACQSLETQPPATSGGAAGGEGGATATGGTGGTGGAGGAGGTGGAGGDPSDPYALACDGAPRVLDAITWEPTVDGGKYLAEAHRFALFYGKDVDAAAANLLARPSGARGLIFGLSGGPALPSNFDRHAGDRCGTPGNVLTEYPCPWFDNGAVWLAAEVEPMFAGLAQKGVSLDVLLIDAEVSFANWNILVDYPDPVQRALYWDVLEAEPRMQPVLAAAGIALPLGEYVEKFLQVQRLFEMERGDGRSDAEGDPRRAREDLPQIFS